MAALRRWRGGGAGLRESFRMRGDIEETRASIFAKIIGEEGTGDKIPMFWGHCLLPALNSLLDTERDVALTVLPGIRGMREENFRTEGGVHELE